MSQKLSTLRPFAVAPAIWAGLAAVLAIGSAWADDSPGDPVRPVVAVESDTTRPAVRFIRLNTRTGVQDTQLVFQRQRIQETGMCWLARNLPPNSRVQVKELIQSPAPAFFEGGPSTVVLRNRERTEHTISQTESVDKNDMLLRCWEFTRLDPVGRYHIQVYLNGQMVGETAYQLLP